MIRRKLVPPIRIDTLKDHRQRILAFGFQIRIFTTITSTEMAPEPISVLFVCLGNICRSPMAEGVFRSLVSKPPYCDLIKATDSAGTVAYHAGSSADSRTMKTLVAYEITDYVHRARQVGIAQELF
jgi:hypothetical protein